MTVPSFEVRFFTTTSALPSRPRVLHDRFVTLLAFPCRELGEDSAPILGKVRQHPLFFSLGVFLFSGRDDLDYFPPFPPYPNFLNLILETFPLCMRPVRPHQFFPRVLRVCQAVPPLRFPCDFHNDYRTRQRGDWVTAPRIKPAWFAHCPLSVLFLLLET